MLQIIALGLAGTILALHFKQEKPEYSIYISVAVTVMICLEASVKLKDIVFAVEEIEKYVSINPSYLKILVKMMGMTYLAEFAASLCKDAGQSTIGEQIRLFSGLCILAMSMPVVLGVLETIKEMMKGS